MITFLYDRDNSEPTMAALTSASELLLHEMKTVQSTLNEYQDTETASSQILNP